MALHHDQRQPQSPRKLFTVRSNLSTASLRVNVPQDLSSITDIATHLAFDVDGVQLLVNKVLDQAQKPIVPTLCVGTHPVTLRVTSRKT